TCHVEESHPHLCTVLRVGCWNSGRSRHPRTTCFSKRTLQLLIYQPNSGALSPRPSTALVSITRKAARTDSRAAFFPTNASCDGLDPERARRYAVQTPPDRGVSAIIIPRQSGDCLALGVSLSNHFALRGVEGRRSTETLALGLRTGNANRTSLAD